MRRACGAILGFALACARSESASAEGCVNTPDANRETVLSFYRQGLVNRAPRPAFTQYVSSDFVEHKPDVATGTRDSTAAFLERLMGELPEAAWQIHRTIAEGDMVFLHASFTPAPGAPAYAIADVFRLRECRIVEHWDAVGPPPSQPLNTHPRF
jgi:predicted SnoaL-like aldol condensation-catalyzing enzyme